MDVFGQLKKAQLENTTDAPSKRGEVNFNTSDTKVKYHDGSNVRTVVNTDEAQTLTNKTIVAEDNTITTKAVGNLGSTELNNALAELQSDIDNINSELINKSTLTTKGDLIAAASGGTPSRLPVGTNGQVLTANSEEPSGLRWSNPGTTFGIKHVNEEDTTLVAGEDFVTAYAAYPGGTKITLPEASECAGRYITIKAIGTFLSSDYLKIGTQNDERIDNQIADGNGVIKYIEAGQSITLFSNGEEFFQTAFAGSRYIRKYRDKTSAIPMTSSDAKNITTEPIRLGPGEWEIQGAMGLISDGSSNMTVAEVAISRTSGAIPLGNFIDLVPGENGEVKRRIHAASTFFTFNSSASYSLLTPISRVVINPGNFVDFYLVGLCTYSTANISAYGQIQARKIRA